MKAAITATDKINPCHWRRPHMTHVPALSGIPSGSGCEPSALVLLLTQDLDDGECVCLRIDKAGRWHRTAGPRRRQHSPRTASLVSSASGSPRSPGSPFQSLERPGDQRARSPSPGRRTTLSRRPFAPAVNLQSIFRLEASRGLLRLRGTRKTASTPTQGRYCRS